MCRVVDRIRNDEGTEHQKSRSAHVIEVTDTDRRGPGQLARPGKVHRGKHFQQELMLRPAVSRNCFEGTEQVRLGEKARCPVTVVDSDR